MRLSLGFLLTLSWLLGQGAESEWTGYGGSEILRHRYHRGYLPPVLMNGGFVGVSRRLVQSGRSYQVRLWAEGRLALPVIGGASLGRFRLVPGASAGLAFQVALPEADHLYLQVGPGLDAYWMQIGDPNYTSFSRDGQLRPILLVEIGLPTRDGFPFFVRYGFYPTPGMTSRMIISMGSYFRI